MVYGFVMLQLMNTGFQVKIKYANYSVLSANTQLKAENYLD